MSGETLGGYRLLEQLGGGDMGTLYLAQALDPAHPHFGVPVATTPRGWTSGPTFTPWPR